MIAVRCIDGSWHATACNYRLARCEEWLKEHVGRRFYEWDWAAAMYGVVLLPSNDTATAFKLRFGI
jgi:hypothetical protein